MWKEMTSVDYEFASGGYTHKPTGMQLVRPESVPHGDTPGPFLLTFGTVAGGAVELHVRRVMNLVRARHMGEPFESAADAERFRRRFGELSKVEHIVFRVADGNAVWDRNLIDTVTILFFLYMDLDGFLNGRAAYPDVLEWNAPELPAELRGAIMNKYARVAQ